MQFECAPHAPQQWARKTVHEIAEVNPRYSLQKAKAYPFVEMAAVAEDGGGITGFDWRKAEASGLARFKLQDILFAKITPCPEHGKVALIRALPGDYGLGSTEFIVLSPREGNDPSFIYHLLCSHRVRWRAISRMEGSTGRLRIPEDTFLKWLLVAVPDYSEQKAIARILNAADAAISAARFALSKAQELRQGVLRSLLARGISPSGQIREPKSDRFSHSRFGIFPAPWQVVPLREVAEVGSGVTLGRDLSGSRTISLPYLRVANVQDGHIDTTEMKTVAVREEEVSQFLLQAGDVVMTEGGDIDKLGRGAIWDGSISPCLHQNHIFRVRADRTRLNPHYLAAVIAAEYGKRYFMRIAKRTTNLASINKTQLRAFPIPLPSIEEQDRIIEILAATERRIQPLERRLNILQRLKRGLMQDLLTGRVRVPVP